MSRNPETSREERVQQLKAASEAGTYQLPAHQIVEAVPERRKTRPVVVQFGEESYRVFVPDQEAPGLYDAFWDEQNSAARARWEARNQQNREEALAEEERRAKQWQREREALNGAVWPGMIETPARPLRWWPALVVVTALVFLLAWLSH